MRPGHTDKILRHVTEKSKENLYDEHNRLYQTGTRHCGD